MLFESCFSCIIDQLDGTITEDIAWVGQYEVSCLLFPPQSEAHHSLLDVASRIRVYRLFT